MDIDFLATQRQDFAIVVARTPLMVCSKHFRHLVVPDFPALTR